MKKIISLFKRDYEGTQQVYNEVVPGAEWVIAGEGIATEQFDGTCCMVRGNKLYKRYDAKKGKTPPDGFEPAQSEADEVTGHWPGWLPVGDGPEDKWHKEAWIYLTENFHTVPKDGTYELIGPKIQGNPYKNDTHRLIPHGQNVFSKQPPKDFEGLKSWLESNYTEGIVWHHPDGRMVKLKRKDLGLPWPIKETE